MDQNKQQVREFYDQIGWSQNEAGLYQNARYEDLRPVAREYIHNCRLRVNAHLAVHGRFLLDAGSGPVQYPEYLTYSQGYRYRLCADLSITALRAARQKLGERGLYVVADLANLPFGAETFDGIVSLHTIHHLPLGEHRRAYLELQRVLGCGRTAVVVNGWTDPLLMRLFRPLMRLRQAWAGRGLNVKPADDDPTGTFVEKLTAARLARELAGSGIRYRIYCWRSLSTRFLRAFIHPALGGRYFLRVIFWLEERLPRFLGEKGQYPLIVIRKGSA